MVNLLEAEGREKPQRCEVCRLSRSPGYIKLSVGCKSLFSPLTVTGHKKKESAAVIFHQLPPHNLSTESL